MKPLGREICDRQDVVDEISQLRGTSIPALAFLAERIFPAVCVREARPFMVISALVSSSAKFNDGSGDLFLRAPDLEPFRL